MKICILKCDTASENTQKRLGDYNKLFEKLLTLTDEDFTFYNYNCHESQFPSKEEVSKYEGFIISGSRYCSYSELEWIKDLITLTKYIISLKKKLLGICFGHQIVSLALSGKVESNKDGWGIGVKKIELTKNGDNFIKNLMKLTNNNDILPKIEELLQQDEIYINYLHRDIATFIPDCKVLAVSSYCKYASISKGDYILTFQGHPEYDSLVVKDLVAVRTTIIPRYVRHLANYKKDPSTYFFSFIITSWLKN